jgi:hypothetical protein
MIGNDPTPDCETRSVDPDPLMTNDPMLPTAFLALEGPGQKQKIIRQLHLHLKIELLLLH